MLTPSRFSAFALLAVLLSACAAGEQEDVVRRDATVTEMGGGGNEAGTMDADVVAVPEAALCSSDMNCASTPATPVCDRGTGRCVECTSANDRCPAGQFCDGTRCATGCATDAHCTRAAMGTADAGTGLRCDSVRRLCVGCRNDTDCMPGSVCGMASTCVPGCNPSQPCPSGQTCCNGTCQSIQTDLQHCGMCGRACMVTNGTPACTNGRCAVAACNTGFGDCDSVATNGCETDTRTTTAHCGGCGMACPARPNATASCMASRCVLQCMPGTSDCNNMEMDGCEVDTTSSPTHCGRCGNACPSGPNSSATCSAGMCGLRCNAGFADCNNDPSDGCEVELDRSTTNCGRCGNRCTAGANATVTCTAGTCRSSCMAGFDDCNGLATDGCEASLSGIANCGRCGNMCTGTTPFCSPSTAGMSFACNSGCTGTQTRCGSSCIDTSNNVDNCGSCGNVCPTPTNGTRTCSMGRCGITCNMGFENCDGNAANGCEARLDNDSLNCGACNRVCGMVPNGSTACRSSQCVITGCNTFFYNCDGVVGNGCEVNASSSLANCGTCGNMCSSNNIPSPTCSNGMCGGTCATNTANCDMNAFNGCEANLSTDPRNCGACGTVCSTNLCGTTIRATMATMPTDWLFNGNASYSAANQSAILTNMATNQAGTIWYRNPLVANVFDVSFEFRMGSGGGAARGDGLAFALQRNGNTAVGRTGSGLGVVGLMGFGVEFDSFNNNDCGDMNNGSHTALISLTQCNAVGQPQTLVGGNNLGFDIADNTWHSALLRFNNGSASVQIDGSERLTSSTLTGFNPNDTYWFGFGAGTGNSSHRHEVRNITITFPATRCL